MRLRRLVESRQPAQVLGSADGAQQPRESFISLCWPRRRIRRCPSRAAVLPDIGGSEWHERFAGQEVEEVPQLPRLVRIAEDPGEDGISCEPFGEDAPDFRGVRFTRDPDWRHRPSLPVWVGDPANPST